MHDVCALIEGFQVGFQDIKMKGWGEHAPMSSPLLPAAQKQSIP